MKQCKCGGIITNHPLGRARTAWTCRACGRYEAIADKRHAAQPAPRPQAVQMPLVQMPAPRTITKGRHAWKKTIGKHAPKVFHDLPYPPWETK